MDASKKSAAPLSPPDYCAGRSRPHVARRDDTSKVLRKRAAGLFAHGPVRGPCMVFPAWGLEAKVRTTLCAESLAAYFNERAGNNQS
jgi:hypothetical protein